MAEPDYSDSETLDSWLREQPCNVRVAIAVRAALRVFPNLMFEVDAGNRKTSTITSDLVLPVFRALSVTWVAAKYPTDATKLAVGTAAAYSATATADTATSTAAADTAAAAAFAAAAASSAATDPAYSAAAAAHFASSAAFVLNDEAAFLKNEKGATGEMVGRSLWPNGQPNELANMWSRLRQILLSTDGDWDVWTRWYEARLNGGPTYSQLSAEVNESIELARVLEISDEDWKAGPKVVNAKIREIEDRYERNLEPIVPEQGSGPHFSSADGHLDHAPTFPAGEELDDPTQSRLLEKLQQRMDALASHLPALKNQYPTLAETVEDYQGFLKIEGLGQVDVPGLWMTGAGLLEQARAFEGHNPDTTLTPALEPETLALLKECARLHGALIMGFEEGRKLAERSGVPSLDRQGLLDLLEHERSIIANLLKSTSIQLTDGARQLLEALQHQLLDTSIKVENLTSIGFPVVRNLLIFVGKMARQVEGVAARAAAYGAAAGLPAAMEVFFHQNFGPIAGFAASVPELHAYFSWLYDHLEEIDRLNRTDSDDG